MKITKRTFEALRYPKGSAERARLNLNPDTSEYYTSYRYSLNGRNFRTKAEALAAQKHAEEPHGAIWV